MEPIPLWDWAEKTPIILDGRPFTFTRHEYLQVPYRDEHPYQVEMKAAQLGLTSKAMLKAIHGARYGGYRGILYLFPSKSDVTDFSKGRIDPLIDDNLRPSANGSGILMRPTSSESGTPSCTSGNEEPGRSEIHPRRFRHLR